MGMESRFTWMDGKLVPTSQAVVPFLTAAMHYGQAVFEGIRSYRTTRGPAVFRLREHIRRMDDSARLLGLAVPYSVDQLVEACLAVVSANEFNDCYIRPLVFTTTGGWNLNVAGAPVSVGIAAWEWTNYLGENALKNGIRANVSSYTRHHPNVTCTKAKIAGNYVNSTLAKTESVRLGFDEAIMLDPAGYVSEATGQSIFLVRGGKLVTPPKTTILESITREAVIELARDLDLQVSEEMITRDQVYLADEAFLCGTATEVIGLAELDARPIGAGRTGPVTRKLQEAYRAAIHGENSRYLHWLQPVNPVAVPAVAPRPGLAAVAGGLR